MRAVPSQEVEQYLGVPLHSTGIGIPIGPIYNALECAHLEVVLHVYGKDVGRVGQERQDVGLEGWQGVRC